MTVLYVYSPWFIPVPGLPPVPERVSEAELRRVHDQTAASVHAAIAAGIDVDVAVDVVSRRPGFWIARQSFPPSGGLFRSIARRAGVRLFSCT